MKNGWSCLHLKPCENYVLIQCLAPLCFTWNLYYIVRASISLGGVVQGRRRRHKRDACARRGVSAKEGMFLGKSMQIQNVDKNLNITRKYITPGFYSSGAGAKNQLALPYAPNLGVWTFQSEIQATKLLKVGWDVVRKVPGWGDGGGLEGTINQPFPIKGVFLLGE